MKGGLVVVGFVHTCRVPSKAMAVTSALASKESAKSVPSLRGTLICV